MYYITVKLPVMYHQMSFEEFMFGGDDFQDLTRNKNETATRTYEVETISERFKRKCDVLSLIRKLESFNETYASLYEKKRAELYHTFFIPKKSGGLRRIDAPEYNLMNALRNLKSIFENDFGALYHTNAYAYIKNRSTIDALKRHQYNQSRWFGKYDLSNFFGSTTLEFVIHQFEMIYPFCEVLKFAKGREQLTKALDLAFLNGGLPQGTPISPTITNIMMIPIDYKLSNMLRDYKCQHYVYTRYADDFQISSKYDFRFKEIERMIVNTLAEFGAPFQLNAKKTRYGSNAGQNWNLGLMLNSENNITVGHKKKRQFEAMLASYVMDKKNGITWDKNDIQVMEGLRNYYKMVEGQTIDNIVAHVGNKFNVDIVDMICKDLKQN